MIVETMTHEEVYMELEREREGVTRWWRHQLEGLRRRMLKCSKFPQCFWIEHTSPRRNRYIFFTRIFDKRMKAILTGIGVQRRTSEGTTIYTTWLDDQMLISPMVLLPHMWKRYSERAGVHLSGAELVKHYFLNNAHGADSHNQKVVGRSVRYNGEEHLACCVNDGVLLGQVQGNMFIAKTFITYDMCTGRQQEEFESQRKRILTDREMYDEARKQYV